MGEVVLEFKVKDDGSINAVASNLEQTMRRVQRTANDVSAQIANPYTKMTDQIRQASKTQEEVAGRTSAAMDRARGSSDQASLSLREIHRTMGAMALAFGDVNPMITMGAMEIARFGESLGKLPTAAKISTGAMVGIGVAVGAVVWQFQELEKQAEVFAKIDRAARTMDLGSLQSGASTLAIESDTLMRRLDSPVGLGIEASRNIGTTLNNAWAYYFGGKTMPNTAEALEQQEKATRDAMQHVLPWQQASEAAVTRAQMAAGSLAVTRQGLQERMASGDAMPSTIDAYAAALRAAQGSRSSAERDTASAEYYKQTAEAEERRTKEIEAPLLLQRYQSRLSIIMQQEQAEYHTIETMRMDALRSIAKQEIALTESSAKDMMARRVSAIEIGAAAETSTREAQLRMELANMSPDQLSKWGPKVEGWATSSTLASVQDTSAARVRDLERTQTQMKAVMQGYLASGLISERDYTDKVRAMDQELTMAKLQGLQQYESALGSALAKAAGDYQKYTDQVRTLDKAIRDTKRSTANDLADIKEAGMSPAEAQADKERRANEALTDAMQLSGQEQVDALRAVQNEYKSLGLAAASAAKAAKDAGKTTADSFDMSGNDWRTTPGQHSAAFNKAWAAGDTGPGSAEWWSGGAWGNNAWSRSSDAAQQQVAQTAADKVKSIGDLIVAAQTKQKDAAQAAATSSKQMVDSLTLAANEAARLASSLASAAVSTVSAAAAGAAQQAKIPVSWDMYGTPIYDQAKAAESKANSDAFVKALTEMTPEASDAGLPTPGGSYAGGGSAEPQMAEGGIVPGPIGSPRRILAHAGEGVFNPSQIAALGRAIAGAGGSGGTLVVQMMVNGETVVGQIAVPLQKAIAAGRVRVN